MTNLSVADYETLLKPPSKSVKMTAKKHVESRLKRHELNLVYQHFRFDHKFFSSALTVPSMPKAFTDS